MGFTEIDLRWGLPENTPDEVEQRRAQWLREQIGVATLRVAAGVLAPENSKAASCPAL